MAAACSAAPVTRQQRRRVDGDDDPAPVDDVLLAARAPDRDGAAEHGARRGDAEAHHGLGVDQIELGGQPLLAGHDLGRVRLLVDPARAHHLEPEVLDRVGEVHVGPVDTRFGERPVEHGTGWSDERPAGSVLPITRLLADEHQRRAGRALTEDGLRRPAVQVARGARACVGAGSLERIGTIHGSWVPRCTAVHTHPGGSPEPRSGYATGMTTPGDPYPPEPGPVPNPQPGPPERPGPHPQPPIPDPPEPIPAGARPPS